MAQLKYVDWDGLVYYDQKIKEFIKDRDESYFKMGGAVTSDNLPSPSFDTLHYVYKITNKFTSTDRFVKPGYTYAEGTWVVVIDKDETYYYDILVEDQTSTYYTKDEVDSLIPDTSKFITEIPATYITEDELASRNFVEASALEDFATEDFVKEQIADLDIDVDLTDYYTKSEVDAKLDDYAMEDELQVLTQAVVEVQASLDEKANIEDIPDVSELATKSELAVVQEQSARNEVKILALDSELVDVKSAIENLPVTDLTGYATEEFVRNEIANIPEVDLTEYAKKSDIPTDYLTEVPAEYVTESELAAEGFLKSVPDTYATKTFVESEIAKAQISGEGDITEEELTALLSNYYTKDEAYSKSEVDAKIPSVEGLASTEYVDNKFAEINVPTNVSELTNDAGYITLADIPEADLTNYFTKEETQASIEEAINTIELPDTSDFITMQDVEAKGYLTEHQDISHLATKDEVSAIETMIPDVSGFATTTALEAVASEIKALDAVTTKQRYEVIKVPGLEVTYRDAEIRLNTEHITLTHQNVGEGGNANEYYIGVKIYAPENATHIKQIITSVPGNFGDKEIVPFEASDVDSYGRKYSYAWIKCGIYNASTETWLNYGMNSTPNKCLGYYYSVEWYDATGNVIENDSVHVIFTNDSCHYSNVSDAVNRKFTDVENKIPDVSGFATIEALEEAINNIEHPTVDLDGYATEAWVENKKYLTNQSLANYYTKAQTDSAISEAVSGIEIPEVDLTPYATIEQLGTKANNVLFTQDMRVNTPVGGFAADESLQNMTIAQILTKLLGLTEYIPPVTPEGILEGTPEAAVSIITNETPSYMLARSGDIVVNPYNYRVMTTSEGAQDNQEDSFLYQIIDDNNTAIETGYHITTEYLDEGFLTVLIPETVTNFEVKVYDSTAGDWTTPMWTLIENSDYTKDGYIAYTADPAYEIYEGIAIRVVIK